MAVQADLAEAQEALEVLAEQQLLVKEVLEEMEMQAAVVAVAVVQLLLVETLAVPLALVLAERGLLHILRGV